MDREEMIVKITEHPSWVGASAEFLREEASYDEIEDLYKEMVMYDSEVTYAEGGDVL